MKRRTILKIVGIIASTLLLNSIPLHAQSGRGELTVTAVVVASVGVELDPDGTVKVIAANAPDPRDNMSRLIVTVKPKKAAKKADQHK
jgi:hypothetical protein